MLPSCSCYDQFRKTELKKKRQTYNAVMHANVAQITRAGVKVPLQDIDNVADDITTEWLRTVVVLVHRLCHFLKCNPASITRKDACSTTLASRIAYSIKTHHDCYRHKSAQEWVDRKSTSHLKAFNPGHGERLSVGLGGMYSGHSTGIMCFLGVIRLMNTNALSQTRRDRRPKS